MSIAQISPKSVLVNPAHSNPQVRTDNASTTAQASQTAENAAKKARTDTVTISRQAAQMSTEARTAEKPKQEHPKQAERKVSVRA